MSWTFHCINLVDLTRCISALSPGKKSSAVVGEWEGFVTGQRHQQNFARMEAERRIMNGQQGLVLNAFHSSTLKSNGIFPNAV
jgi:hypothetical protein